MSNITTFQLDADVSKLVASIEKAKGEFDVLQKKVDEVKGVLPNVFNTGNSDALLKSIRAQNKELDAEKQALNDLNKYLKVLEATQKQAFQSGVTERFSVFIQILTAGFVVPLLRGRVVEVEGLVDRAT